MNAFTRSELVGISISILVLVAVLSAVRFLPTAHTTDTSTDTPAGDVIFVETDTNLTAADALAVALLDASDTDGRIRLLVIQDTHVGTGREVRAGDTAVIHYTGVVQGGVQFASTYDTGEPFAFQVGARDAIEGLERGVMGMKEGGQRILVVPASMAYGKHAVGPVPANATLIFSVALVDIE